MTYLPIAPVAWVTAAHMEWPTAASKRDDPVGPFSFPLPSPSPGKLDSYTRFPTCLPSCTSAPAGHQADSLDAANSDRACISCNRNSGTHPASWVYGASRIYRGDSETDSSASRLVNGMYFLVSGLVRGRGVVTGWQ